MSQTADEADVVVVGGGLAGLRCAADIASAGLHVVLLEGSESLGGRIRTDSVDGFMVDRGFQLLNPAYPALSDLDIDSLGLQPFGAGVAAREEGDLIRLGHPWHAPRLLAPTAAFVAQHPVATTALARWVRPLLHPRSVPLSTHLAEAVAEGRLAPTLDRSWAEAGLSGTLHRILQRFLAGVLLDETGRSPADLALLLVSSFIKGTPSLPALGMQALPRLLSTSTADVRTSSEVTGVRGSGSRRVVTSTAGSWRARAVVIATDAPAAGRLLGTPSTSMRGVVTAWYAAGTGDDEVPASNLLHVDAGRRPTGPLVNTAVVSNAAPTYAPPGYHLIQASSVISRVDQPPHPDSMRRHAGQLLGCDPRRWHELAVHHVPHALPDTAPPLAVRQPVRVDEGLYVCGDHRDTPSIQGALVSGRRAARQVCDELRARPLP